MGCSAVTSSENGDDPRISMFELPTAFDAPAARIADPETSQEAAADAQLNASKGRLLVMWWLWRSRAESGDAVPHGLTDFELAKFTGWQQTSIGKRRGECMKAGFVQAGLDADGKKRKRPAPSGSAAIVWEITDAGVAWYEKAASS
jgi:hypothetical protein